MINQREQERLDRIRHRLNRGTRGEWRSWVGHGEIYAGGEIAENTKQHITFVEGKSGTLVATVHSDNENLPADKALIVNAPADMEFLMMLVDRCISHGLLHDSAYHETDVKGTRQLVKDNLDGILDRLALEPPRDTTVLTGATVIGSKETARLLTEQQAYDYSLTHYNNLPPGDLAHIHFHCELAPKVGKDDRKTYALVKVSVTNGIPTFVIDFNHLPNTNAFLMDVADAVLEYHRNDGLFGKKYPPLKKKGTKGQKPQGTSETVSELVTQVNKGDLPIHDLYTLGMLEKYKQGEKMDAWEAEAAEWWMKHEDERGRPKLTQQELIAAMKMGVLPRNSEVKLAFINVFVPSLTNQRERLIAALDVDCPKDPSKEGPILKVVYSELGVSHEELRDAAMIFVHTQIMAGKMDAHATGRFLKERYMRQAEKRTGKEAVTV